MDMDAVQALVFEPLENLATLLQSGELPGDQAGELLALVLAGCREKIKGRE